MTAITETETAPSLTGRRWRMPDAGAERAGLAIAQRHGIPEIVGRVLAIRGVGIDEAKGYLSPTLRDMMPDPSTLADMDTAAERLARAVAAGERVGLFGDYDVDGGASVALVQRWLRALGVEARVHIPDRIDEGYGPNDPAMVALARDCPLILCLDCGTLSHGPIAAARGAGADVIVADHHIAGETLPDCTAVVNPNRHDDESGLGQLCAAGVAFLLLAATNRVLRRGGKGREPDLRQWLDLVALATVADVAPLTGLNRAFVRQGLHVMRQRRNAGLRALADVSGMDSAPTPFHLGFLLGPRVNAGGRIGEADMGARLLATDDDKVAAELAARLDACNRERREIEAMVLDAAIEQVETRDTAGGLVWAADEGWHPGVVGIVASRLKERYNRPAIVIGFDEAGLGKGSGRSVSGIDLGRVIHDASGAGLLLKGGGHRMAAGLTVARDSLPEAMDWIDAALCKQGADRIGPRTLTLDGALAPRGATLDLCEMLEQAGPFGAGAPAPRFVFPGVRLDRMREVGTGHFACSVTDGTAWLDAIAFRAFETDLGPALMAGKGRTLDVAGRIQADEWQGRRRAKLFLEDAAVPRGGA